jgi:hypothetical protein
LKVRKVSVITAILIAIVAFAAGTASAQLVSFTLVKPYTLPISVTTSQLKVDSLSFTYDSTTNQYSSATVSGKNYDTTNTHYGKVYVVLKDSSGTVVASGSAYIGSSANPIPANTAFDPITVSLTWTPGKSVNDVASGQVAVEQLG